MQTTVHEIGVQQIFRHVPPDVSDARSISELALRRLRSDILSGRLAPGTKLRLKLLTSIYHIGISPLRDALALLAGDGLVVLECQRGFRVTPVSRADLFDVGRARKHIELAALAMSIDNGDEQWRRRVREAYANFCPVKQKVGDNSPIREDWEEPHRAFHLALLSACSSPSLMRYCEQLHDRFDRYRRIALPSRSYMGAIGDDHEIIMNAALAGERERAVSLLGTHLADGFALVADAFKDPEDSPASETLPEGTR
jgi:DNA-binding GntR family transcriptional regulator